MKVFKKVINVIIDVIVVLILLVSILVVTLSLTSKSSGVPNLFGYAPLTVESNSMEDTLQVNDLIFCKLSTSPKDRFEEGDIVTFWQNIEGQDRLNTHRIVEVIKDDGQEYYRTQGDNKKTNPEPDELLKTNNDIVGVYSGTKIGGIGGFLSFIRTQTGFFFCILLPMILFFAYEAIRVIMNVVAYNKEKAAEAATAAAAEAVSNSELTEEQKQRAIAEYLAQQQSQAETPAQDSQPEVQTPASADATAPDDAAGSTASPETAETADSDNI